MKKVAVQFVGLGRPPRMGEWAKAGDSYYISAWDRTGNPVAESEAHERREVEVEVPDPVPEWINEALHDARVNGAYHAETVACRFRKLVAERAKAAAEKMRERVPKDGVSYQTMREEIIREEFLK